MISTVFDIPRIPCTFLLMNFNLDFFCITLLAKCEYDNKTVNINQTYITLGCKEKCLCDVINENASRNCSSLCNTLVDPVCRTNTQHVEVYQQPLKGTNCSCPSKRCITGLKLQRTNYLQIFTHRAFVLKRFEIYDFTIALDLSL